MITNPPAAPADAPTVDAVVSAMQAGRPDEGRRAARAVLAADPGSWAAWHLASILSTAGGGMPRLAAFRRAAVLAPDRGELWASLAAALIRHGSPAPALVAARRGIGLDPATSDALTNLGVMLKDSGELAAAASWFDRAGTIAPANPVYLNNRGLLHLDLDENRQAAALLHRAVAASPFYVDARLNLAIVERRLERPSTALAVILPALLLTPSDAAFLGELGTVLVTIGEAEAGLAWLRRALAADPGSQAAMASCLGALSYASTVTETQRRRLYGAAAAQARGDHPQSPAPPLRADGRITIGYVSATWREHPTAQQVARLLAHHRRDRVRTIAYADMRHRDALTDRLEASVEVWRDTTGLPDRSVAELVRADAVDALVFLAPHEEGMRRHLPARRAAPLQISLHDIATSGFEEMDAWITDEVLHPADTSEWFSERLIRLPSLFLAPPLAERPAAARSGAVRFASFNNPAKLSVPALEAWAEILRLVPSASLLLAYRTLYRDPAVSLRVRRVMAGRGIDESRIVFEAGTLARDEHLDRVAATDVVLDPFPYNGNTATMEALWMGVPVVSLAGTRFVGRMGTDLLTKIGHADLVARSVEAYVAIAVALAGDPSRRAALRRTLRAAVQGSDLMAPDRFARAFEDAVIDLVQRRRR